RKLLDAGVSLQRVRKAVEYLQNSKTPATGVTLMSDGNRIYAMDSPEAVVDLLSKGQGVFAIAVDKVATDLEGSLSKSSKSASKSASGSASGGKKTRGAASVGGA